MGHFEDGVEALGTPDARPVCEVERRRVGPESLNATLPRRSPLHRAPLFILVPLQLVHADQLYQLRGARVAHVLERQKTDPNELRRNHESDRLLGTRDDAEAAGSASVGVRRVRALAAVGDALEASQNREPREVGVVDAAHLEHTVGADVNAVALPFAARAIDDGMEPPGLGPALFARTIRMSRGLTRLLGLDLGFAHGVRDSKSRRVTQHRYRREEVCRWASQGPIRRAPPWVPSAAGSLRGPFRNVLGVAQPVIESKCWKSGLAA